jgi:signal transduction histidine kinase
MLQFQSAMEQIPPSQAARDVLEKALDQADVVIAEGRDRVTQLRTTPHGTSDLVNALQSVGSDLSRDGRIGFLLAVEGQRRELNPIVSDEVQRIAGEALANAFRHAHAKQIDVNVNYARSHLVVSVVDDGCGFDGGTAAKQPDGHWGLKGMQERAARIRARLDVTSARGAGTAVELAVPATMAFRDASSIWRRLLSRSRETPATADRDGGDRRRQ